MNVFATLRTYAEKWTVKEKRNFTEVEINAVKDNVVVESEYGNSVCFFMASGGQTYIPLSNDSTIGVGETIDMSQAKLLTLSKTGENDILRVEI
jgi:hypothetical protein